MTRRGDGPSMRAVALITLALFAGCAGSNGDTGSTVAVATDTKAECAEVGGQGLPAVDNAADGETGPATVARQSDEQSPTDDLDIKSSNRPLTAFNLWMVGRVLSGVAAAF
jgi:hypothetical protein